MPNYTPISTKLKGGYIGFTLSVHQTDVIMSILYLQQYLLDTFHIYTSYQATSEGVSHVDFLAKITKFEFLAIFFKFVTLTLSCFDLESHMNQ